MILIGDALEMLRTLPDESVQTVVTSPPYYGLRDYGVAGQIGLESSPQEFLARLVAVFEEVRRVLKTDGTAWVNMGDSYANDGKWGGSTSGKHAKALHRDASIGRGRKATGLKPKDLMGMPWRLAFALQDAGWWLRQDIIFSKPNPMPESVRDRCTKAHEYLFLLSKSERYFWDFAAMQEPVSGGAHARGREKGRKPGNVNPPKGQAAYEAGDERHRTKAGLLNYARKLAAPGSGTKSNTSFDAAVRDLVETRNRRSVWTIPTEACKEAHFATFPQALVEPCILAGSRPGDTVLDPFLGAGTTALVAERLGRRWVGIELNPEYAAMAERRLRGRTMGLPLAVAS